MKKGYVRLLLITVVFAGLISCKKTGSGTKPQTKVDPPAGSTDGVTFINAGKSVVFNLYAPNKASVAVIGEFNNWQPAAMNNSTDGTRWWIEIDNLDPAKEYAYQYLVDGSLKVADPYTEKVLDPANDPSIPASVYPNLKAYPAGQTGIVSTFWYGQPPYTWQVTNFQRPSPNSLVVYELLVRDFVGTHSYQTLADTLSYIVSLGCNAIELMPVNEFEGNDSWGYNPISYLHSISITALKTPIRPLSMLVMPGELPSSRILSWRISLGLRRWSSYIGMRPPMRRRRAAHGSTRRICTLTRWVIN